MFEEAMPLNWHERSRRGVTALTSFGLQALAVGIILIIPLLRPMGLPAYHPLSTPISLGQPMVEPHAASSTARGHNVTQPAEESAFHLPRPLRHGAIARNNDSPPSVGNSGPYIPGATPNGDPHGLTTLLDGGSRPVLPTAPPKPNAPPLRISRMSEGDLVRKVLPIYPPPARSARIQGQVVLQAVISRQGNIENLRLLSGHPLLAPAAIDAVRQWRYRPYMLNNEAVEVETQITVNFSLGN